VRPGRCSTKARCAGLLRGCRLASVGRVPDRVRQGRPIDFSTLIAARFGEVPFPREEGMINCCGEFCSSFLERRGLNGRCSGSRRLERRVAERTGRVGVVNGMQDEITERSEKRSSWFSTRTATLLAAELSLAEEAEAAHDRVDPRPYRQRSPPQDEGCGDPAKAWPLGVRSQNPSRDADAARSDDPHDAQPYGEISPPVLYDTRDCTGIQWLGISSSASTALPSTSRR